MPAPISTTRTGTGWTLDVTSLVLSTNLGYKDFYAKVNGVASPLINWTKTNSTLLTYTGVSLAANTSVVVYRDSDKLITDYAYAEVNTSLGLNSRFDQMERIVEDLRQLVGAVV